MTPGMSDRRVKLQPIRVPRFNELGLPGAVPALELLLARNGFVDVAVALEPDQPRDAIALRETRKDAGSVLFDAQRKVTGDADLEGAVLLAGKHVNRIALIHAVSTVQAPSVSFPARQRRGKGNHGARTRKVDPLPGACRAAGDDTGV